MEDIYKEKYIKYKTKYNAFKKKIARKLKELSKFKMPKGDPKMAKSLASLRASNLTGNLEKTRPVSVSPQPFLSAPPRPVIASPQPFLSAPPRPFLSALSSPFLSTQPSPFFPTQSLMRPSVFIGSPRFFTAPSTLTALNSLTAPTTLTAPSSTSVAPSLPKPIYPIKKYQIVYGVFNKDTGQKLNLIKSRIIIPEQYVDKTFIKTILEAHTSIVYEPEYNIDTEADTEKVIASIPKYNSTADLENEKMYPGFLDLLSGIDKIDDLVLVGANAFFRENRVIIKVTFNSDKMNDIRNFLYSLPSMEKYKQAWVERLTRIAPVLRSKYGTSKYFEEDKTFAEPPEGWIHHTISVVNGDIPINILDKIIDDANGTLFDLGFVKGNKYSIDELKLRTYDLNHFPIWKKHVEPELK